MLYCEKCKVSVKGRANYCPLCQGTLSGVPEGADVYPIIKKRFNGFLLAVRIIAFISLASVILCAGIDYSITGRFFGWWLYVAGGIASFWIPFGIAVKLHGNVTKSIVFTSFFCCVTAFFWDLFTEYRGWSLDIFFPSACCAAMLAMVLTALILSLEIEQYIYYLIIDIIFGIISFVLLVCGVIKFIYPTVGCIAASAITLAGLLIFNRKALIAEIVRRTHL